jgi:hypothetical protein
VITLVRRTVEILVSAPGGPEERVSALGHGDHFGEIAPSRIPLSPPLGAHALPVPLPDPPTRVVHEPAGLRARATFRADRRAPVVISAARGKASTEISSAMWPPDQKPTYPESVTPLAITA